MSGVFLGMSAGTLVSLGLSAAGTAYSAGKNQSRANTQSRLAGSERKKQETFIQQARDTIQSSNAFRELGLNKKMYEDQLDALIASQGGQNLGGADQRNVTAGAARQSAILNKGLESVTQNQIKEAQRINEMVAKEDVNIADKMASMDVGQANMAAENAKAFDKRAQSYQQQANKDWGTLVSDVVTPLATYGGQQLDSAIAAKGIQGVGADEFGLAGFDSFNPEDLSNFSNEALKDAIIANPEWGRQMAGLYSGGNIPETQQITDLMIGALDYDTIRNITGGF